MASQLFALLAASGLVAAGAPDAHKTTKIAKPALVAAASANPSLVAASSVKPAGACFVPVEKGKLAKLADIRKARAAGKCSNNLMQGGAGVSTGVSTGTTTLTSTLITVGASVGASVGINQAINNSNTPNI